MNNSSFDTAKYRLGSLCKRDHEWGEGSNQSLRRITDNSCLECEKIANRRDPEKRFRSRFEQTQGCWLWKGRRDQDGYGKFTINRKHVLAHRFSYELHYGSIPPGLQVCHDCDIPACVRPDHLFLGTIADNMADKVKKNRQAKGEKNNKAKFTEKQILAIRNRYVRNSKEHGAVAIAQDYGVNPRAINNIVRRIVWKHV